jgi:hypothetical protein
VVAEGTPEEVAKVKESFTGQYLKRTLVEARRPTRSSSIEATA